MPVLKSIGNTGDIPRVSIIWKGLPVCIRLSGRQILSNEFEINFILDIGHEAVISWVKGGWLHVGGNNTLIARSLDCGADLTVPNVTRAHNDCSSAIRRHCQEEILAVLQGISTVSPIHGL